ncbi:MAG TPA: hypothetical protein VLV87_02855 [Gammaproteobacteria bacterium]|nr:hypothetical protein [Gammaproteobacteria bacterium]
MKKWIMPGAITVFAIVGLVLIIVRPDTTPDDSDAPTNSFGADLTYTFDCKGKSPSVQAIQQFMADKGFQTLDKVAAGKKLTPDFSWMKLDVVGLDSAHRQISFKTFADQPDDYHVSLYSEPPTQHDTDLEGALMAFTGKTLGCKNHRKQRLDNPAGAKGIYDKSVTTTEGWFQQAAGTAPAAATATAPAANTR